MKSKFFTFTTALLLTLPLPLPAAAPAAGAGYVAHEWGTFTSVQGSDGELIQWDPFIGSELPAFVHDRNRLLKPAGTNATVALNYKGGGQSWLQRMETPVIYFYTARPLRVDATVEFPKGLVTEWFPLVESFGPRNEVKRSFVQWKGLEVRPSTRAAERALPVGQAGSHYYAARATDAALVTSRSAITSQTTETDKFLFYRGVGNFTAPLRAKFQDDRLALLNRGEAALGRGFVLEVRGAEARLRNIPALDAGAELLLPRVVEGFRPLAQVRAEIGTAMAQALGEAGLYEREASAMVKTWEDAWFSEPGLRVLYLLPQSWADAVLPLKLEPAPRELVRVFVGRAELLAPELEQGITKRLEQGEVEPAVLVALQLAGLGRFAPPALQRARLLHASRLAAQSARPPGPPAPSPYE